MVAAHFSCPVAKDQGCFSSNSYKWEQTPGNTIFLGIWDVQTGTFWLSGKVLMPERPSVWLHWPKREGREMRLLALL